MEWQISVWLEFTQEEGCIRVKNKTKHNTQWDTVDKTKTTFISLTKIMMVYWEKGKKKAFPWHCAENLRNTLENMIIPAHLQAISMWWKSSLFDNSYPSICLVTITGCLVWDIWISLWITQHNIKWEVFLMVTMTGEFNKSPFCAQVLC